jgi:hypothetical protein
VSIILLLSRNLRLTSAAGILRIFRYTRTVILAARRHFLLSSCSSARCSRRSLPPLAT